MPATKKISQVAYDNEGGALKGDNCRKSDALKGFWKSFTRVLQEAEVARLKSEKLLIDRI